MKHLIILAPVLFLCIFFFVPNSAHAATLYYNDNDGDEQWANLDNWWQDAGFTIQAAALPGPNDDVICSGRS